MTKVMNIESKVEYRGATKEKKASAGSTIRMIFANAIKEGKVTDTILNTLTNAEATKAETGIKFAFLKEFDQFATMKEQVMIKNKARYSTKMVEINGKNYLVTNALFERNINPFKAMFEVE